MAPHRNSDGSVSDGVKAEGYNGVFVSHSIGISITSVTSIATQVAAAVALGAVQCVLFADGGVIRFTLDSTNPTATSGLFIPSSGTFTMSVADAAAAKFIQASGSSAVLSALFTM
jgi:hypothetical protein